MRDIFNAIEDTLDLDVNQSKLHQNFVDKLLNLRCIQNLEVNIKFWIPNLKLDCRNNKHTILVRNCTHLGT